MASDRISLLCTLCELEAPEVTGQSIDECEDGPALASLCALGALIHVGNSERILCLECDHPHSIGIECVGEGNYRAYCPDSGYQVVQPQALRRFAVDEQWIAKTIGSKFEHRGVDRRASNTCSSFQRIGGVRLGSYKFELFFGRRLFDRARFEQTTQSISGLLGRSPGFCRPPLRVT